MTSFIGNVPEYIENTIGLMFAFSGIRNLLSQFLDRRTLPRYQ